MTEIWNSLSLSQNHHFFWLLPGEILGQVPPSDSGLMTQFSFLPPPVLKLVGAIAILLLGWVVAAIAASVTRGLLKTRRIYL